MNETLGFSIDHLDPTANPAQDSIGLPQAAGSIRL